MKDIKKVINDLQTKPASYILSREDWLLLSDLYRLSSAMNKDYLINNLCELFDIQPNTMQVAFSLDTDQAVAFIQAEQKNIYIDNAKIEKVKERTLRIIPNLVSLNMNRIEWLSLAVRLENCHRLTRSFLLHNLGEIKKIKIENLIEDLETRQMPRNAKHIEDHIQPAYKKFKSRHDVYDISENPMICDVSNNDRLAKKFVDTGVRMAELTPCSPVKEYDHVKQTPGKTKVHKVYENQRHCFYKPLTPIGSKEQKGKLSIKNSVVKKLSYGCCEKINFRATKNQILERQGAKRHRSQNQLAGMPCVEYFKAHGVDVEIKVRGSEYHWSHLWAFFLGGEQNIKNLVPGTAVSNYNTLKVVELHIANKLMHEGVDAIDVVVEPKYTNDETIPYSIEFNLSWLENENSFFETIIINPRSYQPFTGVMLKSIEIAREFDKENYATKPAIL